MKFLLLPQLKLLLKSQIHVYSTFPKTLFIDITCMGDTKEKEAKHTKDPNGKRFAPLVLRWSYSVGSSAKRRRTGGASSLKGFLRPGGVKHLLPNPNSYRPQGGQSGNFPSRLTFNRQHWLPDQVRMPLKWTFDIALGVASGVGTQINLMANSVTDPGGSSASTAPYGYDWLASIYQRYRVYACAIQIEHCIGPGGSSALSALPYRLSVWPQQSTNSYVSDPMGSTQLPYGKVANGSSTNNLITNDRFIRNYMSTAKIYGKDPVAIMSDDLYGAALGGNPSRPWYWSILASEVTGTITNSVLCSITLIQYVELEGLVPLAST